jgi:hypothetical protein
VALGFNDHLRDHEIDGITYQARSGYTRRDGPRCSHRGEIELCVVRKVARSWLNDRPGLPDGTAMRRRQPIATRGDAASLRACGGYAR